MPAPQFSHRPPARPFWAAMRILSSRPVNRRPARAWHLSAPPRDKQHMIPAPAASRPPPSGANRDPGSPPHCPAHSSAGQDSNLVPRTGWSCGQWVNPYSILLLSFATPYSYQLLCYVISINISLLFCIIRSHNGQHVAEEYLGGKIPHAIGN